MTHILLLPAFTPPSVNRVLFASVKARMRIQKGTRDVVVYEARRQQIPLATGKRRVSLAVTLGKCQRRLDPANVWKVLEDALVCAGVLKDDSEDWVEHGSVTWKRGERQTVVTLQDLDDEEK